MFLKLITMTCIHRVVHGLCPTHATQSSAKYSAAFSHCASTRWWSSMPH